MRRPPPKKPAGPRSDRPDRRDATGPDRARADRRARPDPARADPRDRRDRPDAPRGDRRNDARPSGPARGHAARAPEPATPLRGAPSPQRGAAAQKRSADLPPVRGDRLEGRNVVVEALERGRRPVRTIWLDVGARPDEKITRILALAADKIVRVERAQLDRMSLTGVHNGVIAEADPLPEPSVRELLEHSDPFLVLVDEIQYEHNLGAVLRSALGAGVNGVVIPTQRGKGLTPVVQRVSMGGAEAVPVVRAGISSALADIRRAGVRVIGADMDGAPPWELDLTGPIAFVLGGEDKGLTDPVRKRCDAIAGIPLAGGLQSLNVSVTAGILLFERVRQEAAKTKG